jgi:hypothetical protein
MGSSSKKRCSLWSISLWLLQRKSSGRSQEAEIGSSQLRRPFLCQRDRIFEEETKEREKKEAEMVWPFCKQRERQNPLKRNEKSREKMRKKPSEVEEGKRRSQQAIPDSS